MTREISNRDDTIDSRDVIARFAELTADKESLESEVESVQEQVTEAQDGLEEAKADYETAIENEDDAETIKELAGVVKRAKNDLKVAKDELEGAKDNLECWDDADEYESLRVLCDEGELSSVEWADGVTMIRDSYFEDYAQELAEEIGAINHNLNWPNNCIDWERAANELKQDYTSIEFDGVEYWVRS